MTRGARVVVDGRGARRARRGHPWIYADNVVEADALPGSVVEVHSRAGEDLSRAVYSPQSKIALRRVAPAGARVDAGFWSRRLHSALELRPPAPKEGCQRLLHADADGFPGLVVDRYGDLLVFQATTVWADRAGPGLVFELAEMVAASAVIARNDARARALEGLPSGAEQLRGAPVVTVTAVEAGVRRVVDPWRGHKTGLYLDQQDNHRRAPEWLRGRVLDLFCGEGGFAVPLAAAGCEVLAIDQNAAGLERAARAAGLAACSERISWRCANAFEWLASEAACGAFDAVIVDPPPFARRRRESRGAARGYRDLLRRAMARLAPGGRLLTFSCSFAVGDAELEGIAREAAEESRRRLRILERPGPAADHPELLELPESRYLRGLLMEAREM